MRGMHRRTHRRWQSLAWVTLWNLMLWAAVGMPMTGGSAWAMASNACDPVDSCCAESVETTCALASASCAMPDESGDDAPADPVEAQYCCCFCGIPLAVLPYSDAMAPLPLEHAVSLTLVDQPGLKVPAAIFHPPQC